MNTIPADSHNAICQPGINMEMIHAAGERRVRRATCALIAAITLVTAGLVWFLSTFAGSGLGPTGYVVAVIVGYQVIARRWENLANEKLRARIWTT